MNQLLQIIKERRSIRQFQSKEIPSNYIDLLIESIIWAPSAGNLQARKFYFIFNNEIKRQLAKAALGQDFIYQAPLVVVGCGDLRISYRYGSRGKNLYIICDVSASVQNLMLVSHSLGLGSVWVGAFDDEEVSNVLRLPKNLVPIAIVPIGYPNESPDAPQRVNKNKAIEFVR